MKAAFSYMAPESWRPPPSQACHTWPCLALIPPPGPDWPRVVGTLLDGTDLVVVADVDRVTDTIARTRADRPAAAPSPPTLGTGPA